MIWDTTKYFLTYDQVFRKIYVKQIKRLRKDFFKIIENASKKNYQKIDWWVSPIGERNNYSTKLFHFLCIIDTIEYFYLKKIPINKIILDNQNLYKILKNRFPKYNFELKKEKKYSNFFITIIKHLLVFLTSKIYTNHYKLKKNSKKIILVDKFISSANLLEDRYYNHFFERKKNVMYFPTIVNLKIFNLIKTTIKIQRSKKFLNKFDLLNFNDFIFSIFYIFRRKKLFVKNIYYNKINISRIINDEILRNRNINASIIGIQNYLFAKRLSNKKIYIKKFVNWFENTAVDKGLNLGFNTFAKNIETIGYQGFTSYKEFMCLDPLNFEKKYNLLPNKIVCIGKNLIKPKKEFYKNIDIVLGPALRFNHVYKNINIKKKYLNSVLVNLNLDVENSRLIIENIMSTDFYKKFGGKIYLKSHPLMDITKIVNVLDKKNIYLVKGNIFNLASKFKITITSGATSSIMETLAAGCKLCFPFDNFTDAYSLKLMNTPKSYYKVCSNISELSNYLIKSTKSGNKIFINKNFKKKIFNELTKKNQIILQ